MYVCGAIGAHVWYHSRSKGALLLATVIDPSPAGPESLHIQYHGTGDKVLDHTAAKLSWFYSNSTRVTHSPKFCSVQKTHGGIPAKNLVSSRRCEVVWFCGAITPPPLRGGGVTL